jgi:hypothetical protein
VWKTILFCLVINLYLFNIGNLEYSIKSNINLIFKILGIIVPMIFTSCGSSNHIGKEEKIDLVDDKYPDTDYAWRYSAKFSSNDINSAKAGAINICRGELLAKVIAVVKGGVSIYSKQIDTSDLNKKNKLNNASEYSQLFEREYTTLIDGVIKNSKILINEMTRNTRTGMYTSTIVIELPKDSVSFSLSNQLGIDRNKFRNYLNSR